MKRNRSFQVILPKSAVSPSGSIYKRYDIVSQGSVLHSYGDSRVLTSSEPFVVRALVSTTTNSQIRTFVSEYRSNKGRN